MNEEERVLFQVTKLEGGSSAVRIHTETEEDVFAVALAIHQIMKDNQIIRSMIEACTLMSMTDVDFDKQINSQTVEIPDFDKILKENK